MGYRASSQQRARQICGPAGHAGPARVGWMGGWAEGRMGAPSHVCWICVPEMCNNFYEPGAVTTKAKGGRAGSGSALRSGRPSACVIDKRRGERGRGMHGMQPKGAREALARASGAPEVSLRVLKCLLLLRHRASGSPSPVALGPWYWCFYHGRLGHGTAVLGPCTCLRRRASDTAE